MAYPREPHLPSCACDTHVHVFDPSRFPYDASRTYTPGTACVPALRAFHGALGVDRAVLVQPSVYGTDNACLLSALADLGPARARGIVVVDDEGPATRVLDAMHAAGVRGIRLNIEVDSGAMPLRDRLQALRWLTHRPGWCLQLHASAGLLARAFDDLAALGVPVVLDHYAGLHKKPPFDATAHLPAILEFLAQGPGYLKLSAPYRRHATWSDPDLARLAVHLADAAPTRILWGSDWPHTGGEAGKPRDPMQVEPFRSIDNGAVLTALRQSLGDPGWHRMLQDNAQALYGFDSPGHPTKETP